ncbi:hypothetical protein X975_12920, partial [Stegodyphus mimosarum]
MKYLLLATVVVFLIAQVMGAVPYPAPLDHQMSEDYNESLENYLMRTDK